MSVVINEKLGNSVLLLGVGSGMTANANVMDLLISSTGVTNTCLGLAAIFTACACKGIVNEIKRQVAHHTLPVSPSDAKSNLELGNLSKITGGVSTLFNGAFVLTQFANGASLSAISLATILSVATGILCFKGGSAQVSQSRAILTHADHPSHPAPHRG